MHFREYEANDWPFGKQTLDPLELDRFDHIRNLIYPAAVCHELGMTVI